MSIQEILNVEEQNKDEIYLYRQGLFLKAFQASAMRFEKRLKPYQISVKRSKKLNVNVFSLGFPATQWPRFKNLCEENFYSIHGSEDSVLKIIVGLDADGEYERWCQKILDERRRNERECGVKDNVVEDLLSFPTTNKTPLQAMQFLNELQNRLRGFSSAQCIEFHP